MTTLQTAKEAAISLIQEKEQERDNAIKRGDYDRAVQLEKILIGAKLVFSLFRDVDDWTMIMTDQDGRPVEETLPEPMTFLLLSIKHNNGMLDRKVGYYHKIIGWCIGQNMMTSTVPINAVVYAYKSLPAPAPNLEPQ